MKKQFLATAAIISFVALGACNKQDTTQAQNVADVTDNKADNIDAMANNVSDSNLNDKMENQADAVRANGSNAADAIDAAADNGASNATLNAMAKKAAK